MGTRRVDLGSVELEVDDLPGGGPPLVMIHGWLGNRRTWADVVPALAARHRVVALDLRGHGGSSVPDRGFGAADMAGDVAALITRWDLGPSVVLAHSMGTAVATRLAVTHGALVTALVLIDPDYGGDPDGRMDLAACEADTDEATKAAVLELFRNRIDAPTGCAELRRRHLDAVLATPARVVAETLRSNLDPTVSIRFRPEAEALLPSRLQPVLSFHRKGDRAAWERRQALHPASEAVVVPSTGHWIHEERPGLVVDRTIAWLDQLRHSLRTAGRP